MKRLLLFGILLIASSHVFAQKRSNWFEQTPLIKVFDTVPEAPKNGSSTSMFPASWMCFASDISKAYPYYIVANAYMWPDTNLVQPYLTDSGNSVLLPINLHHVGQVLNPLAKAFNEHLLFEQPYIIDSIQLAYEYLPADTNAHDSIEISLYGNDAITKSFIGGNDYYYFTLVQYDTILKNGPEASLRFRVPAQPTKGNKYSEHFISIPNIIAIAKGNLAAVTYQFLPETKPSQSDTLIDLLGVQGNYSLFRPLIIHNTIQNQADTLNTIYANQSLFRFDWQNSYELTQNGDWSEEFSQGHYGYPYPTAQGHTFHTFIAFHTGWNKKQVSGIQNNQILNIYPNPSNGKLFIDLAKQYKDFSVYSLDGILKQSGIISNQIDLNLSEAGIYLIELKDEAGQSVYSKFIFSP